MASTAPETVRDAGGVEGHESWAAQPPSHRIDSGHRWFPNLREVTQSRDLVVMLSKRQVTVTYRQTVLGVAWVILSPLMSAGLFTFVFGNVAHIKDGGVPYFAFSYAGLLGWNFFASTLTGVSTSLTGNATLISKIYFPRLVLPLSSLASTFIQLGVSVVVMTILLLAYQLGFTVHLLLLPVWLLIALVLAIGIGLILTAVSVSLRDVNNVAPTLISLFLYLTPVAYATDAVPSKLRHIFLLNPLATPIEGCRWSILGHGDIHTLGIVYSVVFAVIAMVVGLVTFARLEWSFADVI